MAPKKANKSTVLYTRLYIQQCSWCCDDHNIGIVGNMTMGISQLYFLSLQLKSRAFHGCNSTYQTGSRYQGAYSFLGQNTTTNTSTVIPSRSLPDISVSGFPKNLDCYPRYSFTTNNAMLIYSSQVIEVVS